MKRFHSKLGILVAGAALAAAPAFAGQSPRGGGSPGGNRETAVERPAPSGTSGGASSASTPSASTPAGGSTAAGSSTAVTSTSPSAGAAFSPRFARAEMAAEPQRRGGGGNSGGQRAGGGQHASGGQHSGGERAVPRGSSGNSGSTASSAPAGRSGGSAAASTPSNNREGADRGRDRAVPTWSRPRGDHPVTGVAVDRSTAPPGRGGTVVIGGRYYNPYYPYGFGYPGFGLGLGFGFYDPWYDPWFGGLGYGGYGYSGYGYGCYGYGGYGDPYVYGGGYGGGYSQYRTDEEGSIRLKVKPQDAKVYVDGYFVGVVDSFDGVFQKLSLTGGGHHIEVKADGYQSAEFDALITPGQTVTYQGELKKIQ
jgi:hypothetical protein